ncbi:hypothetical protein CRE_05100 [Caenorhabditis remanei]|uniref:Uncharacterized protein n=1 Tax=Caenorhabditis remanei TaxID=31234 RepID=E3MZ66_CAERE|nr:hypothetical protein CRE_05100 [Caenorhabditis remanei]
MTPELDFYYTTLYPRCNITYSFLSSREGLIYPCHVIQLIVLPLQVLTFYVILKKTPMTMKSMKWPLLINHFWCSCVDLLFCSLVTPYLYIRIFGFICMGLLSYIGVSNLVQVILSVLSVFCKFL